MIIILGLIILVAAVIAGVAGVLSNSGSGHGLAHGFSVFGYHVTGSTGTLFLYGIVAGRPAAQQAAGMNPQSGDSQSALQTPAGASAPADDSPERVSQP
jgi:hypothetical protein